MTTNKMLFKESKDEKRWTAIREGAAYAAFRNNLKEAWQYSEKKTFLPLGFELFMIYTRTGSRKEYSQEYFSRRLALNSSFMGYMIYREEKYLKKLEEIIMLILDEYTWAAPAHLGDMTDCERVSTYIDLFAAETGHALSEILYILEDKLDERVSSRIHYEIDRRIISSFLKSPFSFEKMKNNWATVCAGSVGMTFLYMTPEKFPFIKERIKVCFLNYLEGFGNDGACTEGVGYWIYGFGYYTYFEELYKEFSGEYLIPISKKHKEIAMFLQRVHIGGGRVISFSDSSDKEFIMNGLVCRMNDIYGDDVYILPEDAYAPPLIGGDNCYRFAHCIRNFLWHKPEKMTEVKNRINEKVYLNAAQWYIKRTTDYIFAVKGGRNNEPHNHNDVGSFLISDYNDQLVADIGKCRYDKFYFAPETRYKNLCCSSLGHSVPIIDGCEQSVGEKFKAKNIEESDNYISMDISDAYDNSNVVSFIRSFCFEGRNIKLIDEINQNDSACWIDRLVSTIVPVIEGTTVIIGKMKIYNNLEMIPEISCKEVAAHLGNGKLYPVYLIDFKTNAKKMEFTFSL